MCDKLDLFEAAAANRENLTCRWQDALERCSDDSRRSQLEAFHKKVRSSGRVSINMTSTKLTSFAQRNKHVNPHQLARELASKRNCDPQEVLRELQGKYYQRRVCFDHGLKDGDQFVYGALNIGGMGVESYGDFCVVFCQAVLEQWKLAFLRENSLDRYVSQEDPPRLKRELLRDEAGGADMGANVAGLKHERDDLEVESSWASLLCHGPNQFVEAVLVGDTGHRFVEEIRVHDDIFNCIMGAFADAPGATSGEISALVAAFQALPDELQNKIEVVARD